MPSAQRLVLAVVPLLLFGQVGFAQQETSTEETNTAVTNPSPERGRDKLLLAAGITLAGTYALTIVADHAIDNSVNFNEALIPAVGPFLAIAHYDDKVSPSYSGRDLDKALFALSGIVQTAALTVIVVRLFRGRGGVNADRVPVIAVGPMGRGGFIASCSVRF